MKAAIDIGSNSLRLLVIDENHRLVLQKVVETRLGEGFREGSLTSASMSRTLDVLEEWQKELADKMIDSLSVFATSAVRDAVNRQEFATLVKNRIGIPLRILSGEEEAYYSFCGAVGGFDFPKETSLLIDIGGGSTEIALFQEGHVKGISMPFGAVRWKVMAYRRNEVKRIMAKKVQRLDISHIKSFIAVGGTATTAAAILGQTAEYQRNAIHGKRITKKALIMLKEDLSSRSLEERKKVVGLPPPRADIILFGLEILEILFELMEIDFIYVSDWGILDGILEDEMN